MFALTNSISLLLVASMFSVGSGILPQVTFFALSCQSHLLFSFTETIAIRFRILVFAMWAADATHEGRMLLVYFTNGHPTCVTLIVATRTQFMVYGDATIKHKTLTLPL